jgi:predicted phage-related endonuclease
MAWGRDLEHAILRRFGREHPELSVQPGALYRSGDNPRFMATPDGLAWDEHTCDSQVGPSAVVQAKTAASQEHWGETGTDEVPVYYVAQVRFEMLVMDVRTAYVPVLFSGRTYREYIVHQDDDDAAFMVAEAEAFLRRLDDGDPPDIDWRISTTQALKQLHPDVEDTEVEIPATWVRQAQLAGRLEKAARDRKVLAENRIRAAMGRAQRATVGGRKVATRSVFAMKARTMPATTAHRLTLTRKDITA